MPYDLFISYAHKDNSREQVRELRDAIVEDFHKFAGRELKIFFDEHDIPGMADWEDRIGLGLRESRLFLAVLSPNYFVSDYCRREWEEYIRYEAIRQCLGEGVAPVYFVELPGLDGPGVEQRIAAAVDEMRKRQWCDLASQRPVKIVRWHDAGKRALEDAHVAERLQTLKGEIKERLPVFITGATHDSPAPRASAVRLHVPGRRLNKLRRRLCAFPLRTPARTRRALLNSTCSTSRTRRVGMPFRGGSDSG